MNQLFSTRVTEALGIEHPIVQGGMMWVSQPELVAAVSNAGALGVLTALTFESPQGLEKAIARTRQLTERPFGVNLTLLPTLAPTNYDGFVDAIIASGVRIVETAGRNPQQYVERLREHDILVIHKCTSVRHARKAEAIGCSFVSIDGCECAGHPGEEDVTSLVLIPRTADEVGIPVIASGGFADGRGLVAALSLGADAVNMGTRFMVTAESPVHDNIKRWFVGLKENDTMYVMRSLRNTERVIRNEHAEKVARMEAEGAGLEELAPLLSGKRGLRMLVEGLTDDGLMTAGQCVGLIDDIPTVADLVEGIMSQAREVVTSRLVTVS
jgi:nitronate monooxygenase